ncbi:hypothetical protein [Glycomyces rhizosphaerae]|uniref:Uncharacterized protein n=1 Tax=Glycomyces rhizosphaerae TaxID=2054422 RepID=A0ABV7PW34_9ACTN
MSDTGNDQGGHWPVGIWFAMVGVSAGTVASYALIGWTFARGLDAGDGAEPLEYGSETVIIEAEESPDPEGVAGGDDGQEGLVEPGAEPRVAASAAEPQAGLIAESGDDASRLADEPSGDEPAPEGSKPPQLVPIEEDGDGCGGGEDADDADGDQGWDDGGSDHDWADPELPELDLVLDQVDLELELEPQE